MHLRRPLDFGRLVRDRRRAKGLTQAQLAKQLGVQRSTVIDLERGARSPRLDFVLAALSALGIRLFADDGDAGAPTQVRTQQPDIASLVDEMLNDL